jgi:hypothetical protein
MEETDMGSYLSVCGVLSQPEATVCHPAMALGPEQRRDLALHALAGTTPTGRLAAEHEVSRKFVYRQRARANDAVHEAFFEEEARADEVLFHLPVTKACRRGSFPPSGDQGLARSIDPGPDVDLP